MKNKKVIFSSQHEFTKDKSCLSNLIVLYGVLTGCMDNNKTEDDVYPDFNNMFDMVSHSIHIARALSALVRLNDPGQPHPTHEHRMSI